MSRSVVSSDHEPTTSPAEPTEPDRRERPDGTEQAGAEAFRRAPLDRRTMFRRAGMVALIGGGATALAACSGSDSAAPAASSAAPASTAPASTAPSEAATSASPSSSASTSESPSASASESSAGAAPSSAGPTADAAHTVAKSDVAEGGGTIGSDFVVTQPAAGTYKAFSNVCTHQGCLVNKITNGTIDCPCHGSKYSIKDGSVTAGPAPRPLPSKTVTASGDNLLIGT